MAEFRRLSDNGSSVASDGDAKAKNGEGREKTEQELLKEVRASDIEPYTGLRYLSKLFRFMGVILVLLLVAEVATGVYTQGSAAIPTLLGEASRLIVLAGVLWGTGDLAHLLIDVGHDVRASRILVARVAHARTGISITRSATGEPTITEKQMAPRRNFADRIDNGDDEPPIP